MTHQSTVAFETRNRDGLPLPLFIQVIMVAVFAMPLLVIPLTYKELPGNPWILLFWLGAFFPLAVIYVLKRLFTRFALTLYQDGSVRITQPFGQQWIAPDQLARIVVRTNQAHVGGAPAPVRIPVPWLFFFDHAAKELARVSPAGFDAAAIEQFLALLSALRPSILIQR